MRSVYKRLRLLKTVLGDSSQYSDTPEGDMDYDRFFSNKPAFSTVSDNETSELKKLLLGKIKVPQNLTSREEKLWRLTVLMTIRQAINDGFEVYQYRDGEPHRLSNFSLSSLFDHNEQQTDESKLHADLMGDLKKAFSEEDYPR